VPQLAQAATGAPAIQLEGVSRLYGNFVALRGVSLTLAAGASAVLLGENGAGKSTLLRLVAGLAAPSFGTVSVFGDTPQNQRGRIATLGHASLLYDELTAFENLIYFTGLSVAGSASALHDRVERTLMEVGLDPGNPRRLGEYSQGMKQRASLARVLLAEPDLLLLDEPFANLDLASAQSMIERLLAWLAQPGANSLPRTLLLTTHQAELARPLARTTLTLHEGRLNSREEAGLA
jgi:ABC-type multidrug transport system ATPase subunit